jgi:phytanoyl-CoA hydroxylase
MSLLLPGVEALDLDAPLRHYQEHGYARLGRVLSDSGLSVLRERAEDLMQGRVVHPGLFFQLDSPTGRYEDAPLGLGWQGPSDRYRKLEKLELDERFRSLIGNPLFERVARARIADSVVLYRAILFHKGPGLGGSEIPWHQDGGKLWGVEPQPELQIWVALDDAPLDGGCLEVAPGSHHRGLATELGGVVPADQVERFKPGVVSLPCEAGEAILIHNFVWHRSGRGAPGRRRLAFSACYMSASTRCLRRKKAPRRFFKVFT